MLSDRVGQTGQCRRATRQHDVVHFVMRRTGKKELKRAPQLLNHDGACGAVESTYPVPAGSREQEEGGTMQRPNLLLSVLTRF